MSITHPLVVERLTKRFDEFSLFGKRRSFTAVDHISFELKQGEILGLLGPNGAGKTTTIQMLLSTMTPTAGTITYFGRDFFSHRSAILNGVSFASTYVRLHAKLSIYENLFFFSQLYDIKSGTRVAAVEQALKSFDLWELKDRQAGSLSAGQSTRAMLAKAFVNSPQIVLLDEPTASLDPDVAQLVREFVLKQRDERGTSFLFTSHNMAEVTEVCDRVLVLAKGKIIANNSPEQLAASVSSARITLITHDTPTLIAFAHAAQLLTKQEGAEVIIDIDEHRIPEFLHALALRGITYSAIAIDRPTLEDYFLQISKTHRQYE